MIGLFSKWYHNNFDMFIRCNEDTQEVVLSKALYKKVRKDHPNDTQFKVLFSKITHKVNKPITYVMFFNPEWEKHGVSNPALIFTVPVTISKLGHVGFQSVMPTVTEIFTMYGVNGKVKELSVSREKVNGEPFYLIKRP